MVAMSANPTSVNRTLAEMNDPAINALTHLNMALASCMLFVALYQLWLRRTKFYIAAVLLTLPSFVENIVYFLALNLVIHTNPYLIVRLYSPILSIAQICLISIFRLKILSPVKSSKPSILTNPRCYKAILSLIVSLTLVTSITIAYSYYEQRNDPYFTPHPLRRIMPMIFMTVVTGTDCVVTFVTFHVVWHVRSKVVRSGVTSDTGAKAGGRLKSESTLILASMDTLPSSPMTNGNMGAGTEHVLGGSAMPASPVPGGPQSSSHRSNTASGSSLAAIPPIYGLSPQERRENRRRRRAGLRKALKQLMVALTLMLASVLGGMLCFGLSAGNMLADTISGVFVRMYLLPAISSWSLLVKISKANRM